MTADTAIGDVELNDMRADELRAHLVEARHEAKGSERENARDDPGATEPDGPWVVKGHGLGFAGGFPVAIVDKLRPFTFKSQLSPPLGLGIWPVSGLHL